MRVQVGNNRPVRIMGEVKSPSAVAMQGLAEIEQQMAQDFQDVVDVKSIEITEPWLQEMGALVQEAALQEAGMLFPAIASVMDRERKLGFTQADLPSARGMLDRTLSPVMNTGSVPWQDITLAHGNRKKRRFPANRFKMYRYSDKLHDYFSSYWIGRHVITDSKFGGIEVKVDLTNFREQARVKGKKRTDLDMVEAVRSVPTTFRPGAKMSRGAMKGYGNLDTLLVGLLHITIFPKLSSALIPMLASNRWDDTGDGDLERHVFGKSNVRYKLVNKNNPYRPLFTPILQYWMALQIPDAIMRRISTRFNKSVGRSESFLNSGDRA